MSADQYHRFAHALYQWESATEDLIQRRCRDRSDEAVRQKWRETKKGVREQCLGMCKEVEAEDGDNMTTKAGNGGTENDREAGRGIACITRRQRQRRTPKEEPSDDEESEDEDEQFICCMSGRQWESLPYPIVIDSGACAFVLPTNWCNHVKLLRTPQSEAHQPVQNGPGTRQFTHHTRHGVSIATQQGQSGAIINALTGERD